MLRAAVIGLGSMGRNHARVYREARFCELAAVVDNDPEVAAEAGRVNGVPHFTSLPQALYEAKPDLVSIAVPTAFHHQTACLTLDAGIHTLVEKPIASNLQEANDLMRRAEKNGVLLSVGQIERFNPAVLELRRRLGEGLLGRLYQLHSQRLSPYPTRIRDSGVVIDLASHDIDLMMYLTGEAPIQLVGETLSSINSDREDLFSGMMRFPSGALGILNVNWVTPKKVRQLTLTGALGLAECNLLSQELFFFENEAGPRTWDQLSVLRGVSEGNVMGFRVARDEPLRAQLEDFVLSVRGERQLTVTAKSATESLRVALEFLSSASERGQTIEGRSRA